MNGEWKLEFAALAYTVSSHSLCQRLNCQAIGLYGITEMVAGVNLPATELLIAMGIPLHRIRTIRQLYGVAPHSASEIDFDMVKPESNQLQHKPKTPKIPKRRTP